METLLRIETIPIEYQLQIQKPRLELQQAQNPQGKMEKTPSSLKISTKNIKVRLDTTDMRSSIGLKSAKTLISDAAIYGKQVALDAIGEMSRYGEEISRIQDGVTVAGLIQQKMLEQPDTVTVFLPSTGPVISWEPNKMEMQYDPGKLGFDWEVNQNIMNYVPGKFEMVIKQYPKVLIEYLGDPNYVPPSANPNYEEVSA